MKLYATVSSERATKGQGGKELDIEVKNEQKETVFQIHVSENDGDFLISFKNGERYAKYEDLWWIMDITKGEKKKSECVLCGGEMGGNHAYNCPNKGL